MVSMARNIWIDHRADGEVGDDKTLFKAGPQVVAGNDRKTAEIPMSQVAEI